MFCKDGVTTAVSTLRGGFGNGLVMLDAADWTPPGTNQLEDFVHCLNYSVNYDGR